MIALAYVFAAIFLLAGLILLVRAFLAPDHQYEKGVYAVMVLVLAGLVFVVGFLLANFNRGNIGPGMMFPFWNQATVQTEAAPSASEVAPFEPATTQPEAAPEAVPNLAPSTAPIVLPDCVKVNGTAANYEKLWLRTNGSGIYDLSNKDVPSITSDYFYFVGGKNPVNEDHDIFAWDPNTVVAIRGFELWNCGPIAAFTPKMVVEQQDKLARQKWENDQSNGIKHNIVIHYPDGTVKRYDNGAEVPLPASMKDMNYSACGDVTVPSWQNTPGDVLNSGQPMTSTLGQPGCGSLFIGTRNDAKVAVFWIGVDERFTYSEGNFWVIPVGYTLDDAVNFTAIKQAMAELGITTIQNRDGYTVFPK